MLKIARDFIGPAEGDVDGPGDEDWAFARAIVALGQTLHLAIVAEGIEQRSQLVRLTELGCALGQGFYFSRPVPPVGLEAELEASGMLIRGRDGGQVPAPALAPA
jgi:EAL domain-containing protein (putative c-di-GMP-specific phosphodiesterase class I)